MTSEIYTKEYSMPTTVRSYVMALPDGSYCIVLNANISFELRKEAYEHELRHILNGDYERKCSIDIIEYNCHKLD